MGHNKKNNKVTSDIVQEDKTSKTPGSAEVSTFAANKRKKNK